jgi:hypothetical protein
MTVGPPSRRDLKSGNGIKPERPDWFGIAGWDVWARQTSDTAQIEAIMSHTGTQAILATESTFATSVP